MGLRVMAWNGLVAATLALAACVVLLGRAWPAQATLAWALAFTLFFLASASWLTAFSARLGSRDREHAGKGVSGGREPREGEGPPEPRPPGYPAVRREPHPPDPPHRLSERHSLRTLVSIEVPLFALSAAGILAMYLSDDVNHQLTYFLQPTPAVLLLLAVMATAVAQEAVLVDGVSDKTDRILLALSACCRWALPLSLLLLGLLQGASYLWIIGNDFTRYWAVSDAVGSLAGYPISINEPSYIAGGMYRYSIEMPVFPLLLLASFTALGHDTLAAHVPALLANTALPLLLYTFYHKAGTGPPLAFAASCAVTTFPFFRLYTLNAPVPDAVFVAVLVATAIAFLSAIGTQHSATSAPHSADSTQRSAISADHSSLITHHSSVWVWLLFGLLAGITTIARPEGLVFVGFMFLTLLPNLSNLRLYLAGAMFLIPVVPFSLLMLSTFGIPWPRNAGTSFGIDNIAGNLDWMERMSLRWYAEPFGLSTPAFVLLVWLLAGLFLLGVLWMARERWQLALLPIASAVHIFTVYTVDPRVSGVDQWFDFFRHISYGIPFATLPLLFLAERLLSLVWKGNRATHHEGTKARRTSDAGSSCLRVFVVPPSLRGFVVSSSLALLALLLTAYHLHLLARPSQTYGEGAGQLLTSDVWVTLPDILAHRYQLPRLPFAIREGVLMIDPDFEYIPRHLESVRSFYRPFGTITTGRGPQYEVSSLLVVLFGAVFALSEGSVRRSRREPVHEKEPMPAGSTTRVGDAHFTSRSARPEREPRGEEDGP